MNLNWDLFVAPAIPAVADPPPGADRRTWSPISATLIYGERDAVLVDPLLTVEQGRALADWVATHRRNLTAIYITHGHGDHFFGASVVLERFSAARALATHAVVARMRESVRPERIASFWAPLFPGQIPERLAVAEELTNDTIDLEGNQLIAVPLGHTDTDDTTCLHVPAIELVVAGDAAYNDVHLHLGESTSETRREWIRALDTIEALRPRTVIAGHKRPENDDGPHIIEETRQYIRDFDRLAATTSTALDLYNEMLMLYPQRVNPGVLWASAQALKGRRPTGV
jgi:glyoxylase-like metal-dependent hydrolase (beta-lactamase superfamily II)